MSNLSEQELIRREKLNKIRELGINPYPAELFQVTTNSSNIKSNFIEGEKVIVAGRLMSRRIQGNASFAELLDSKLKDLNENLFSESNPIPVKWALHKIGLIDKGIRLPLVELSEEFKEPLEKCLIELDLI